MVKDLLLSISCQMLIFVTKVFCIKQTFILVKYLKEKALLGSPFLDSIFPMWVDDQGLRTKLLNKEILFEFTNPPGERSINTFRDQVIRAKENHVNLLK